MNLEDPRITAFALDEMSVDERENFESELTQMPGGHHFVDETLETAALLREGLALELMDVPVFSAEDKLVTSSTAFWTPGRISGLAAAALAMLFAGIAVVNLKKNDESNTAERKSGSGEITTPSFQVRVERPKSPAVSPPQKRSNGLQRPQFAVVPTKKFSPQQIPPSPLPVEMPGVSPAAPAAVTHPLQLERVESLAAAGEFIDPLQIQNSTFGVIVPDHSFDQVREKLAANELPQQQLVAVEQLVNHFDYDVASAKVDPRFPFDVKLEIADCPWKLENRLVLIGVEGWTPASAKSDDKIADQLDVLVNFNPDLVASYRLLGYTRNGNTPQTGESTEIKAGHRVTALYEVSPLRKMAAKPAQIKPKNRPGKPQVADFKYSANTAPVDPMLSLNLEIVLPSGSKSETTVGLVDHEHSLSQASIDFRFAAAVAAFGMRLEGDPHSRHFDFQKIEKLAEAAVNERPTKERVEFLNMVKQASKLAE